MPNHNDHGFVKVALDPASLDYVQRHLDRIEDPLLRQLIWQALWNMVRDQQLKSTDYLAMIAAQVGSEPNHELVETILANATATLARYVPDEMRLAEAHKFFQMAWDALQSAPQGDLQIIWGRTLINIAINAEDIQQFARLADGEVSVPGFTVDQEMRWELAARYVAYGLEGAEARVAAERERDPSDRGQRALLRCEVSKPEAEVKAEAWRRFHDEGYGSLHLTSAAMSGFQWYVQRDLTRPYEEQFFEAVPDVFESRPHEAASAYFGGLFPGRVDREVLERSERLLSGIGDRLPTLKRSLREANDDLDRAIKCRAFAAS
jgi:aminopeptidase N